MKKIILVMFLITSACTATVQQTYAPNGNKAYTINCSGTARGWDACQKSAGEICKGDG